MDLFDILTLTGGLSLFLFGMSIMGQALERRAGDQLRSILGRFTSGRVSGLLTGLGVTAVIQSSSAATVMVVGFVNSGLMSLRQAINVIMGANIGTTVTAWILSLTGIDSGSVLIQLLKPSSFTPVLGMAGIILYLFCRSAKKKDTGTILLGFTTLMFGMESMSGAVSGLRDVPSFQQLFILFKNPILGVLAGAALTALIQSSSASVGILQALAVTGQVSYGAAIPIIMGQNIGTCATAMLSSVGANKNAKRAALVHLSFNVIGSAVWLAVFCGLRAIFPPAFLEDPATRVGIAAAHTVFNILCTLLMLPLSGFLERLVNGLIPDAQQPEARPELDERLLAAPHIALERCREVASDMGKTAVSAMGESLAALRGCTPELAAPIRTREEKTDRYEDILGSYLVKLSARQIGEGDSMEAAKLLNADPEEIALVESTSHGLNIAAQGIPLEDGDNIITTNLEFIQVALPWCVMRKEKDIEIRVCKTPDERFAAKDFAALCDDRTRIIVMSTLEWCNGWQTDLKELGDFCKERGIYLVVDAVQQLGVTKIDTKACHIDILTAGGRGLGVTGADGDLLKIGLGGGEGQQELGHASQTVGETSAQVAASHQGTLENHALNGQYADQDVDQHLADDINAANPCAGEALHTGQPELGLFDLIAGRLRTLAESLLPAKETQHIITRQKVFQFAGGRRLLLDADAAQLFHPFIEQLGNQQHDHGSHHSRPQQGPVERQQRGGAEYNGSGGINALVKGLPGQIFNLVDVIGEPGQVFPGVQRMEFRMIFLQQRCRHILPDGIIHGPDRSALEKLLQAADP